MSSPASVSNSETAIRATRRRFRFNSRVLLITLIVFAALVCAGAVLLAKFWPFSEKAIVQDLSEASDSNVTIRKYHATYFPYPGCVVEGVEFRHGTEQRELITIARLRVLGTYAGMLTRHVSRITTEGARVFIPPFGSEVKFSSKHSRIVIDEIVANGTAVEFASTESHKDPLRFDIHEARLTNVRWGDPIGYRLKFHNPNPPGEIAVAGKFGAWSDGHPQDTPMSGDFTFDRANLGVYGGIAGSLSAQGKFEGVFKHINVSGTTDTPDFEVKESGHKVRLKTRFDAYVDAMQGDTFLNHVEAEFGRTMVLAQGSIAGSKVKKGKEAKLTLTTHHGRIEDVLGLFTKQRSPMAGDVSLRTQAEIPPGQTPFLQKLHMNGIFGIDEGSFTKPQTQKDVDELSAGARGQNKDEPENVVSDLKGKVDLTKGVATFSGLDFGIPGAKAQMHGTYNLLNERVDLHGNMAVDTKISKTTSGMKAFMLKVMDPLFKKKEKGEVVPVHIVGTYDKPQFGLDLNNGNQNGKKSK